MNDQTELPVAPVEGAIRNPANPHHFMVVQPVKRRVRVHIGGKLIADTEDALRVIEIGKHAYEPRLYLPKKALKTELTQLDKATHCPLKGDADYFALGQQEVAWAYRALDFAAVLDGYLSFAAENMRIEEGE